MIRRSLYGPAFVLAMVAIIALLAPGLVRASSQSSAAHPPMRSVIHQKPSGMNLAAVLKALSGRHVARTRAARFNPQSRSLDVSPGNVSSLDVNLAPVLPSDVSILSQHGGAVQDLAQLDNGAGSNTSQFALYHPGAFGYIASGVQAAWTRNWILQVAVQDVAPVFFNVNYLATVYSSSAAAVHSGDVALQTIANLGESSSKCRGGSFIIGTANFFISLSQVVNIRTSDCFLTENLATDTNGDATQETYIVFHYGNVLAELDINPRQSDINNPGLTATQEQALLNGYGDGINAVTGATEAAVSAAVAGGVTAPPTATPTLPTLPGPPAQATNTPTNTPVPTPTTAPTATNTPVPAEPSVRITGFVLIHTVKGKVKATKAVKLKEQSVFLVTYTATNARGNTPVAHLSISKGQRVIASGDMAANTLSDGTPYFDAGVKFKQKTSVGKLVAAVKLTLGTATDSAVLHFSLKKK